MAPDRHARYDRYVWLWLPGAGAPTLCGHLRWDGQAASFAYVRSYRDNAAAIAIQPSWPVNTALGDRLFPAEDDALPGVIADVAPGRWGEYVLQKRHGRPLIAMEFLIEGFGGRTGAIELSAKPDTPPPAEQPFAGLAEIAEAVEAVDRGRKVDARLLLLFQHGPSLGGRRPKASVVHDGRLWVAKFVSVKDRDRLQPRREAFGLALARAAGIDVPDFKVVEVRGSPVLLVERFDRKPRGRREHVLSARTLLGLSERQMLNAASYPEIARLLCRHARDADAAAQWFDRMVFNILLGNTDDHALNHLFGWNGRELSLLPAFDLEQQPLIHDLRGQEMIVGLQGKRGSFDNALSAAAEFGLKRGEAEARQQRIVKRCRASWEAAIKTAGIKDRDVIAEVRRTLQFADAR